MIAADVPRRKSAKNGASAWAHHDRCVTDLGDPRRAPPLGDAR
jgi:hypothetical protein